MLNRHNWHSLVVLALLCAAPWCVKADVAPAASVPAEKVEDESAREIREAIQSAMEIGKDDPQAACDVLDPIVKKYPGATQARNMLTQYRGKARAQRLAEAKKLRKEEAARRRQERAEAMRREAEARAEAERRTAEEASKNGGMGGISMAPGMSADGNSNSPFGSSPFGNSNSGSGGSSRSSGSSFSTGSSSFGSSSSSGAGNNSNSPFASSPFSKNNNN